MAVLPASLRVMPKALVDSLHPLFRPLRRFAALACASAVLAACSPAYDWRTLHNDAGYTVDLPAKPTVDEHAIEIAGTPMKMRMQAAHKFRRARVQFRSLAITIKPEIVQFLSGRRICCGVHLQIILQELDQ